MSKKLLIFALVIFFIPYTQAAVYEVKVRNFEYSPAELTITEGDEVKFVFEGGTHPTVSKTAAWTSFTLSQANPNQSLTLATGVYNYYCSFHSDGTTGMVGKITVEAVTGVIPELTRSISLYPNPAISNVVVELNNMEVDEISIVSITGHELMQEEAHKGKNSISLNLANGEYIVLLKNQGAIVDRRKLKVESN